jgi:hypothetical protein
MNTPTTMTIPMFMEQMNTVIRIPIPMTMGTAITTAMAGTMTAMIMQAVTGIMTMTIRTMEKTSMTIPMEKVVNRFGKSAEGKRTGKNDAWYRHVNLNIKESLLC